MTLVALTDVGLAALSAVRMSHSYMLHALFTCLAMGSALVLMWLVAVLQPRGGKARKVSVGIAGTVSLTSVATGLAQACHLLELLYFPSSWLALGEFATMIGFGFAISWVVD